MALTWFRFHADALDNPRLQKLDPYLFKVWVNLQCILAQEKASASGRLPPVQDLAFRLRLPVDKTVEILVDLVEAGLLNSKSETLGNGIGNENETLGNGIGSQNSLNIFQEKKIYFLKNWEKKQYKSDTSTERTKRFRERHRNGEGTPPDQIRSDTDQIRSDAHDHFKNGKDKNGKSLPIRHRTYGGDYDITKHLTDDELQSAVSSCPAHSLDHLVKTYNNAIKSGKLQEPKYPHFAFKAWCGSLETKK